MVISFAWKICILACFQSFFFKSANFGVEASWTDGAINVGDYLNNTVFECAAFSVYLMNDGVSIKQFVFDGPLIKDATTVYMFLNHVPCPQGGNCMWIHEEQLAIRVNTQTWQVIGKFPLGITNGDIMPHNDFVVLGNASSWWFMTPNSMNAYSPNKNTLSTKVLVGADIRSVAVDDWFGLAYLMDTKSMNLNRIWLSNFVPVEVQLPLSAYLDTNPFTRVVYHNYTESVFFCGTIRAQLGGGIGLVRLMAWQGQFDTRSIFSFGTAVPASFYLRMFFIDHPQGNVYVGFQNNASSIFLMCRLSFSETSGTFTNEGCLNLNNAWVTDHFFHSNTLHLITTHGQIIRVNASDSGLVEDDRMTILTRYWDKTKYDPQFMPDLRVAKVFDWETIFIASEFSGYLIQVNMMDWCSDSIATCPQKPTIPPITHRPVPTSSSGAPSTAPVTSSSGGIHGGTLAAIVFGIIGVIICFVVLCGIYILRRKRAKEAELVPLRSNNSDVRAAPKITTQEVKVSNPARVSKLPIVVLEDDNYEKERKKQEMKAQINATTTNSATNTNETNTNTTTGTNEEDSYQMSRQAQNLKAMHNLAKEMALND